MATPSTLIPDLDNRIERAILRCLEPGPQLRPASALSISASLPGRRSAGGGTGGRKAPSPNMIAAAGPTEGLQPRAALMSSRVHCSEHDDGADAYAVDHGARQGPAGDYARRIDDTRPRPRS